MGIGKDSYKGVGYEQKGYQPSSNAPKPPAPSGGSNVSPAAPSTGSSNSTSSPKK